MSGRRVVITGGLGLLGRRILQQIIMPPAGSGRRAVRSVEVMIIDKTPVDDAEAESSVGVVIGCDSTTRADVSVVHGELGGADARSAIHEFAARGHGAPGGEALSFFHLASVMSGQGETDFDEALRVNAEGTASLLKTCREIGGRPRFVFASSIAAFGGGAKVSDETKLLPQTTYGMTKACAELLINDCTRKGFVDGRIARLPTVIIRPGPPNPAATGCFSSVPKAVLNDITVGEWWTFRHLSRRQDGLTFDKRDLGGTWGRVVSRVAARAHGAGILDRTAGQHFVSPVSPDVPHPCVSVSAAVRGLLCLHDASEEEMGRGDRAVTLPSVSLSLRDLERTAALLAREMGRSPGTISYEPDKVVESVVAALPQVIQESERARNLGLRANAGAREMMMEYVSQ